MPDNRRKLLCACVVKASFFPLQFRILLSTLVLLTIASLLGQSNVQGPISIACKNQFVVIYLNKTKKRDPTVVIMLQTVSLFVQVSLLTESTIQSQSAKKEQNGKTRPNLSRASLGN